LPITLALVKNMSVHIVEELIAERATRLMTRKRLFQFIKPLLYRMLAYDAAVFMADAIKDKTGREAFHFMAKRVNAKTQVRGLENIPKNGKCVIISNHPTGLADGLAVFQAIQNRRPNHLYLANADALRVIPKGGDIIIPVEWVKKKRSSKKTRQTLMDMRAAFNREQCVVIFPSGALAKLQLTGLVDKPWESSASMMARKYDVPIIPLKIKARNSLMYYLFSWTNAELRDITLFHELLNKRGQTFDMTFGDPIDPSALPKNADEATAEVRRVVEGL